MGEQSTSHFFIDPSTPFQSLWNSNENAIWLASTLRIVRNIDKFRFPCRLEPEKKIQLMHLMADEICTLPQLDRPVCIPGEELSPLEKDFLTEHFLLFEGVQNVFPGEAFIVDQKGESMAFLNIGNHFSFHVIDCVGDLEASWRKIVALEDALAQKFSLAFSNVFGFLTQDPLICGTGLLVSAYVHVPALRLLEQLTELTNCEKHDALLATGLQGNPDDIIGDIVLLRNRYTLGVSEEQILYSVRSMILKLVVAERRARLTIQHTPSTHVIDQMSRALGILKFSFELDTSEALAALSLVKLGVEIEMIQGLSVQEVNRLFFNTRRGHLLSQAKDQVPLEKIKEYRANFLRDKMQAAQLKKS